MRRETVCLSWYSLMLMVIIFFSVPVLFEPLVSEVLAEGLEADSQLNGQSLGELGLAYAGGSEEEEGRDGPLAAVQARTREANGLGDA